MEKTIVITGSTRGIGFGLAEHFLKMGHRVVINGVNSFRLDQRVSEMEALGFNVIGIPGDVRLEGTHQSIIDHAMERFGSIDIWINNAGIPQSQKYFYELGKEEIENLISVNVNGSLLGTWAAIRFFRKQGHGKIFNMEGFGSDGRMMDKLTLYGTTKRAIHYFSKSVSREVKEENIQVGVLSPGMVRTDFLEGAASTGSPEEQARNKKVFDILAEDVDKVTDFLSRRILESTRKYDRIVFLTMPRLLPRIIKLMFVK